MRRSGIEDWALGATFIFALAFAVTIHEAPHFRANAATEASEPAPQFEMTVTAKRLPAACKGEALTTNADCSKLLHADATVEMHETSAAVAAR